MKKYLTCKYHFFTTYGRTALLAGLDVLEVKGKKVLVPALTCNTTVTSAVEQAGGIPIFVDVDINTFSLDIDDLYNKIDNSVCAVISHHYYGYKDPKVKQINEICKKNGIIHIEDCTHVLGENIKEKTVGIFGDIVIYSFSKAMPNMGGGVLATNDKEIYSKILQKYEHVDIFNEYLKNINTYYYYTALRKKYGMCCSFTFIFWWFVCNITNRIMRRRFKKINGSFYLNECSLEPRILDVSMTKMQKRIISMNLIKLESIAEKKREKYLSIIEKNEEIELCREYSYCPMYLIVKKKDKEMFDKYIELWPSFQKYTKLQKTEKIAYISEKYVAVDLLEGKTNRVNNCS